MSGTTYRYAILAILAVGLVSGGWFLILYRAWRPSRWIHNPVARDASGWVLALWLYFAWAFYRTIVAWIARPNPADVSLGEAVPVIAIGFLLDGAFIVRLRRYLAVLHEEHLRPTRVCRRCGGRGVVPVGTPKDHWDLPWEDENGVKA